MMCCHVIRPLPTQHDLWQPLQSCFVQALLAPYRGVVGGVSCVDSLCCVGDVAAAGIRTPLAGTRSRLRLPSRLSAKSRCVCLCHVVMTVCHNCCIRVVVRMPCTLGLLNACYTRAVSSAPWWTWLRQHSNHPSWTCMLYQLLRARVALIRCCMCSSMLVGTAASSNVLMHAVLLPCVL